MLGVYSIKPLLFGPESFAIVDFLSVLGTVFLLFLAELEIDLKKIRETSRDSIIISFAAALLLLFLGFVFLRALGYDFLTSLVFGGALSVTSEGNKVKVLMDLDSLNTGLGGLMLAAGAIDDIFEVFFLALVVIMAHGGSMFDLAMIPLQVLVFFIIAFVFFKASSTVLKHMSQNGGNGTELFLVTVIFVLVLAAPSQTLQLGYLIGAIIGGFLLQISLRSIDKKNREDIIKTTEMITLALVVPFFFANAGLNFDIGTLTSNMILLIGTAAIAFIGKIAGTLFVRPISSLSLTQLYYVGWAMNSRGAAELVIELVALQFALIPVEIFSVLVAMAMITTLTFPFVLAHGIKKNPTMMHEKTPKA